MNSNDFAELVSQAETDPRALKTLMEMALGDGFMGRLARKELNRIGINVEVCHDLAPTAVRVR